MTITEKVKFIIPFLIAVVCSIAFFSFSFFPAKTSAYLAAKKTHNAAKIKRTEALEKLKMIGKGTPEYARYYEEKVLTDKAWEELKRVKNEDRVFNFTNIQQFFGELGWVLGLFIYTLFNIFRVSINGNDKGYLLLHLTINSISIFYAYWIFQPFQDISLISYYAAAFITTILLSYSIYIMSKYKFSDVGKLKSVIRDLFDFIIIDSKEENLINKEREDLYDKRTVELVKKALDNE
jgi:hypothetical protein